MPSGLLEILGGLASLALPIAIARLVGAWHQIAFVGVTYILSLGLGHYLASGRTKSEGVESNCRPEAIPIFSPVRP